MAKESGRSPPPQWRTERRSVVLLAVLAYLEVFGYAQLAKPFCSGTEHTLPPNSSLVAGYPCNGTHREKVLYLALRPARVYQDYLSLQPKDCWVGVSAACMLLRVVLALIRPSTTRFKWGIVAHQLVGPLTLLGWVLSSEEEPSTLAVWFTRIWPLLDCSYVLVFPTGVLPEAVYGALSFIVSALIGWRICSIHSHLKYPLALQLMICAACTTFILYVHFWRQRAEERSASALGGGEGSGQDGGGGGGEDDAAAVSGGAGSGGDGGSNRAEKETALEHPTATVSGAGASEITGTASALESAPLNTLQRQQEQEQKEPVAAAALWAAAGRSDPAADSAPSAPGAPASPAEADRATAPALKAAAVAAHAAAATSGGGHYEMPLPSSSPTSPMRRRTPAADLVAQTSCNGAGRQPDALGPPNSGAAAADSETKLPPPPAAAPAMRSSYVPVVRMVRMQIKIRGADPDQISSGYQDRISYVVGAAGYELESVYLRRGCIELVVNARAWQDPASEAATTLLVAEALAAAAAGGAAAAELHPGCGPGGGAAARAAARSSAAPTGVRPAGRGCSVGRLVVMDVRASAATAKSGSGSGSRQLESLDLSPASVPIEEEQGARGLTVASATATATATAATAATATAIAAGAAVEGAAADASNDIDIGALIRALQFIDVDATDTISVVDVVYGTGEGEADFLAAAAVAGTGRDGGTGFVPIPSPFLLPSQQRLSPTRLPAVPEASVGVPDLSFDLQLLSAAGRTLTEAPRIISVHPRVVLVAPVPSGGSGSIAGSRVGGDDNGYGGGGEVVGGHGGDWDDADDSLGVLDTGSGSGGAQGSRAAFRSRSTADLSWAPPTASAVGALEGTAPGPFRMEVVVWWPEQPPSFAATTLAAHRSNGGVDDQSGANDGGAAALAGRSTAPSGPLRPPLDQLGLLLRSRGLHLPARMVAVTPVELATDPLLVVGAGGWAIARGTALRYSLEVSYLPARPGLLVLEAIGLAVVPVVLLHNEAAAAELQAAVDGWQGTAEELDDLLHDIATFVQEVADALVVQPAAAAAAATGGGGGGATAAGTERQRAAEGGRGSVGGLPLSSRVVGLGCHLLAYAVRSGWDAFGALLQLHLSSAAVVTRPLHLRGGGHQPSQPHLTVAAAIAASSGPNAGAPALAGSATAAGGAVAAAAAGAAAGLATGCVEACLAADRSLCAALAAAPPGAVAARIPFGSQADTPGDGDEAWLASGRCCGGGHGGEAEQRMQQLRLHVAMGAATVATAAAAAADPPSTAAAAVLPAAVAAAAGTPGWLDGGGGKGGRTGGPSLLLLLLPARKVLAALAVSPRGRDAEEFRKYKASWRAAQANVMHWVDVWMLLAVLWRLCREWSAGEPTFLPTVFTTAVIAIGSAAGIASAAARLLLPHLVWVRLVNQCAGLRQACCCVVKLLVGWSGWPLLPCLHKYELGLGVWLMEGLVLPGDSMLSPAPSLLLAVAKVPLLMRTWLVLGGGAESSTRGRTLGAAAHACGLAVLSFSTNVACHWCLCQGYRRRRLRGRKLVKGE